MLRWVDVVVEFERAVGFARVFGAKVAVRCEVVMNRLSPQQERAVSGIFALGLHLLLLVALFVFLRAVVPTTSHEFEMTLGGPIGEETNTPKPLPMIMPETPNVEAPTASSLEIAEESGGQPAGSPNVTTPAQALSAEHAFPALPAAFRSGGPKFVRLVIAIAEDGFITDASVQLSSGVPSLDDFAIGWVKSKWRYIPAMRGGKAIAVTTTAIVEFSPG